MSLVYSKLALLLALLAPMLQMPSSDQTGTLQSLA